MLAQVIHIFSKYGLTWELQHPNALGLALFSQQREWDQILGKSKLQSHYIFVLSQAVVVELGNNIGDPFSIVACLQLVADKMFFF